ncbi:MAG: CBS domain-containing protein [Bacillota bacterium]
MTLEPVMSLATPVEEYLSVRGKDSIDRILRIFHCSLHKGGAYKGHQLLIVSNNDGDTEGILTIRALIKSIGFKMLEDDIFYKAEYSGWYYIKKQGCITARDLMRPVSLYSIGSDSSLQDAAHTFARHGVNYLPVTDGSCTIGILNAQDVFLKYYEATGFIPDPEPWKNNKGFRTKLVKVTV